MPQQPRRAVGVALVVVAVVLGLAVSCNGFRRDELECEKAVVRLHDCCPNFYADGVDCSYDERTDCSDSVTGRTFPALSLDDSRCIQEKSCAGLVADGDCARAQVVKQPSTTSGGLMPTKTTPRVGPVCTP